MGVNCSATLSAKTDWENVGRAASVLLGAKPVKVYFGGGNEGWATHVEGFNRTSFKPTCMPEYIDIIVVGDPANPAAKSIAKSDSFPYQMWYGLESRTLYPKATAAKIALTVALTKFFGGRVTYNDCTGKGRTFPMPKYIGAEDGKPWYALQTAILELKPLTKANIDAVAVHAAYEVAA